MTRKVFRCFSVAWTVAVTVVLCSCQTATPTDAMRDGGPSTAFEVQGDYAGAYALPDGQAGKMAAQLMAMGAGTFQLNLLSSFDSAEPPLAVCKGMIQGDKVVFSGTASAGQWTGKTVEARLVGGVLAGQVGQGGWFRLQHVLRPSPTLGLAPPDAAVVLFDGTNADAWCPAQHVPGLVRLGELLGGDDQVAYLRAELSVEQRTPARLELGSDDAIKVFLNGRVVHRNLARRAVAAADDVVNIMLEPGKNVLLVKVVNAGGNWDAVVRVADHRGATMAGIAQAVPVQRGRDNKLRPLAETNGYVLAWDLSPAYPVSRAANWDQSLDFIYEPEKDDETVAWRPIDLANGRRDTIRWPIVDGALQVGGGNIKTRQNFGDCFLHVEFRTPFMPEALGQKRGNSGVYLQGRYEVQVLDSYGLPPAMGDCGGIYSVSGARVNMCAPPGLWQTYDITFRAARFDAAGNLVQPAEATIWHNGVMIHDRRAIPKPTGGQLDDRMDLPGPILLQDHGNPVQYRNIWVVPLDAVN